MHQYYTYKVTESIYKKYRNHIKERKSTESNKVSLLKRKKIPFTIIMITCVLATKKIIYVDVWKWKWGCYVEMSRNILKCWMERTHKINKTCRICCFICIYLATNKKIIKIFVITDCDLRDERRKREFSYAWQLPNLNWLLYNHLTYNLLQRLFLCRSRSGKLIFFCFAKHSPSGKSKKKIIAYMLWLSEYYDGRRKVKR